MCLPAHPKTARLSRFTHIALPASFHSSHHAPHRACLNNFALKLIAGNENEDVVLQSKPDAFKSMISAAILWQSPASICKTRQACRPLACAMQASQYRSNPFPQWQVSSWRHRHLLRKKNCFLCRE